MHLRLNQAALGSLLLTLLACSGGGDSKAPTIVTGVGSTPSAMIAVFDPANAKVPLPNVLATAAAVDPISTAWFNPTNGTTVVGARPYGVPMQPSEALAYVAYHEVGGPNYGYPTTAYSTHAVSGVNAPIYIAFSGAVDAATVTPSSVKVFQVLPDANGLTENTVLGFQNVSGLFTYTASASCPNAGVQSGGKEFLLFPKVPLTPGARYLYVVTDGVKDPAGLAVADSPYFEALKSTTPLGASFAALEPIRADNTSGGNILLSGYAKTMNDLITNATADTTAKMGAAATGIAARANITLMGRFITTGAGGIRATAADGTTLKPVDAIIRAFAAGSFGPAKAWNNSITITAAMPAATYYSLLPPPLSSAPHANLATVVLGTFHSADLQIDPSLAIAANLVGTDATTLSGGSSVAQGATNPYSFTTGITQAVRSSGTLAGFYNTDRQIPFVYFIPAGGAATFKTVILQHGITSQKEAAAAAADTIALTGKATIAFDLPMHGALASPANTVVPADYTTPDPANPGHTIAEKKQAGWGNDFMSLTSLLTGRTNVQQAALNLHRLEILMRTGTPFGTAFATWTTAPYATGITGYPTPGATGNISFVGQSLGSIVGAYYLAGNATLDTTVGNPPYTQTSLNSDMKGFLSVPGSTIAYILKDSPIFGPVVNAGLSAASGGTVVPGTTAYTQFFLVAQTLVDPVDPASMTLPLATPLPSRLSGRVAMQEAVGDTVIPNYTTRYLGQALGGRTLFGYDFAPGFSQLLYSGDAAPKVPFMAGATPTTVKAAAAAYLPTATTPKEGYFQFNQTGIDHGFLLDNTTPANTGAAQKQMLFFLGGVGGAGANIVVDPYSF